MPQLSRRNHHRLRRAIYARSPAPRLSGHDCDAGQGDLTKSLRWPLRIRVPSPDASERDDARSELHDDAGFPRTVDRSV